MDFGTCRGLELVPQIVGDNSVRTESQAAAHIRSTEALGASVPALLSGDEGVASGSRKERVSVPIHSTWPVPRYSLPPSPTKCSLPRLWRDWDEGE